MDSNQAMQEIMTLSSMNNKYLQEMMDINSKILIDDINDDPTLNKNIQLMSQIGDAQAINSNYKDVVVLQKKITDNIATINNLSAQIQLDGTYFNDLVNLAKYRSSFVVNDIPEAAQKNENLTVNIQYENIGFSSWDTTISLLITVTDNSTTPTYNQTYTLTDTTNAVSIGGVGNFEGTIPMPNTTGPYIISGSLQNNGTSFGDLFTNYIYIG